MYRKSMFLLIFHKKRDVLSTPIPSLALNQRTTNLHLELTYIMFTNNQNFVYGMVVSVCYYYFVLHNICIATR